MQPVRERLQDLFRDVFDDEKLALDDSMTGDDVEGWDSLMHINLVIAIEKEFGVKFATAEISRMKEDGQNIGSLIGLLERKLD